MKRFFILVAAVMALGSSGLYAQTRPVSPEIKCDWEFPESADDQPVITLTVTVPQFFEGYYDDDYNFIKGEAIEHLDRLEILRGSYSTYEDEHVIYTLDDPEPGKTFTIQDTEPVEWGATYNYSVTATYDLQDSFNTTSYPSFTAKYIGVKPANVAVTGSSDKGNAPFILDMKLPSTDVDGRELEDGISKVLIQRSEDWGEKVTVAEITEGLTPGGELRWVDEDLDPMEGISYYYYVTAYSQYGYSDYSSVVLKLGNAYNPSDVSGITTVINPDKSVDISWNMAEIGFDGGYVPLDDVRFTVKRIWKPNPADWMTEEKVLAQDMECPEMKFSDPADDIDEIMEVHYEIIAAYTDGSGSSTGSSLDIVLGPDYTIPYSDNFSYMPEGSWMSISEKRWMSKGSSTVGKWVSYTDINGEYVNLQSRHADEDENDTWLYFFDPYSGKGLSTEFISHRINIKDVENPVLSLWRHAHAGQGGHIDVFIDMPGNSESIKAGEISFYDSSDIEDGWEEVVLPLDVKNCGSESINLRFVAYTPRLDEEISTSALCIDDVMIDNYPLVMNPEAEITENLCARLSWENPSTDSKTVTGYEVLRNGTMIARMDASEETYTDAVPLYPRVATRYAVNAIYDDKYPAAAEMELYTSEFIEDDFRYDLDEEENAMVVKYIADNKAVTIPGEARMYPVVGVAQLAFAGNTEITEVSFPESIVKIGQEAFDGCTALVKAVFTTVAPPETGLNAFRQIGENAEGVCPTEGYEAYSSEENLKPLDFSKCSSVILISEDQILSEQYYSLEGKHLGSIEKGNVVLRRIVLKDGNVVIRKMVVK